jgi:hypothetical protein
MGKLSLVLRSLVPAAGEVKHDADEPLPDSRTNPLLATYTTDNEISPLIRSPFKGKGKTDTDKVTILRGGHGSSEPTTTQPKAGGS